MKDKDLWPPYFEEETDNTDEIQSNWQKLGDVITKVMERLTDE